MGHLQPNLENVHVRQATRIAPGINLREGCRACIRNPRAVCRGKIENRQIAMLMTHRRAQRELDINRERDCDGQCSKEREFFLTDINFIQRPPKACRYKRDHHQEREKGLRDARMKNADFIFEHCDTKATENSLQDYTGERN
jgi:hypothetical protein